MKDIKSVMPILKSMVLLILAMSVSSCSYKGKFKLIEAERNSTYQGTSPEKVMVMALFPLTDIQTRVLWESTFLGQFAAKGINMVPAYKHFDDYSNLTERIEEITQKLDELGIEALLIIDPIKMNADDLSAVNDRITIYRSMGMDSAAMISLFEKWGRQAKLTKFTMGITYWDREIKEYGWFGTYKIKAEGAYYEEVGKKHLVNFADVIYEQLVEEQLIK